MIKVSQELIVSKFWLFFCFYFLKLSSFVSLTNVFLFFFVSLFRSMDLISHIIGSSSSPSSSFVPTSSSCLSSSYSSTSYLHNQCWSLCFFSLSHLFLSHFLFYFFFTSIILVQERGKRERERYKFVVNFSHWLGYRKQMDTKPVVTCNCFSFSWLCYHSQWLIVLSLSISIP